MTRIYLFCVITDVFRVYEIVVSKSKKAKLMPAR